jgi:hypothetical protein
LCHAQPLKAVPGRKTDSKDAQWMADFLQHGRLARQRMSPARPHGELRERGRAPAAAWPPSERGWRGAFRRRWQPGRVRSRDRSSAGHPK